MLKEFSDKLPWETKKFSKCWLEILGSVPVQNPKYYF